MEHLIYALIGLTIGAVVTWLFLFKRINNLQRSILGESFKNESLTHQLSELQKALNDTQQTVEKYRLNSEEKSLKVTGLEVENNHLLKQVHQLNEEKASLVEKLTTDFEVVASKILSQNTHLIQDQQNKRLADLLTPFKEKITAFEQKVTDTYEKELRDKLSLENEVKRLFDLNQRLSEEAGNLTRALKGDVKQMGNWGELVLERILEQSGLTEGREYDREVVARNSEGASIRPDVIIHLPDEKHIIIDSKVSLLAYERYVNSNDDDTKKAALKEHLLSVRNHIKGLAEKKYHSSDKFNSPDFVLMFIPVEASFAAAVEGDGELFASAWDKHIVPVSPSTLLATLRTIAAIWKQEHQTKNALEIARQSGDLYDKLVGFVSDLDKVGKSIEQVQNHYGNAMNKLTTGRGNLINRAEKIRELGAKNSKLLPGEYTAD